MFLNPLKEPEWGLEDLTELNRFFTSRVGRKFLDTLAWRRPRYSGRPETRLTESGILEGYEDCMQEAFDLYSTTSKPETPKEPQMYPSLDDDTAWKDFEAAQKSQAEGKV